MNENDKMDGDDFIKHTLNSILSDHTDAILKKISNKDTLNDNDLVFINEMLDTNIENVHMYYRIFMEHPERAKLSSFITQLEAIIEAQRKNKVDTIDKIITPCEVRNSAAYDIIMNTTIHEVSNEELHLYYSLLDKLSSFEMIFVYGDLIQNKKYDSVSDVDKYSKFIQNASMRFKHSFYINYTDNNYIYGKIEDVECMYCLFVLRCIGSDCKPVNGSDVSLRNQIIKSLYHLINNDQYFTAINTHSFSLSKRIEMVNTISKYLGLPNFKTFKRKNLIEGI